MKCIIIYLKIGPEISLSEITIICMTTNVYMIHNTSVQHRKRIQASHLRCGVREKVNRQPERAVLFY